MLRTNETGRSMVEMLGVLAVMGVLSVGGVAMYTSAMNKHRANELLNAVSVRATALASQRMTGKALSLAGFTDNTQGTSVIDVNSSNAGAIEITISNVPLSVCKNMYNTRGDNVIEMKSGTTVLNGAGACEEGATVSIKFNNDLSKGGSSSGDNFSAGCTPACNTGEECIGGACISVTPNTTNGCTKNSDCTAGCASGKTCYCAISATKTETTYLNCTYSNFKGTCTEAVEGTAPTGTNYKVSNATMTWWSAINFCKAVKSGGQLVNLEDVDCHVDINGIPSGNYSLSEAGYPDFWTKDSATCDSECVLGSNDNSCNAWAVITGIGGSTTYCPRSENCGSALCK